MRIQVLGPLSAEVNGGSIVPTAGKPRQILSLLALYPGRVMPVPTLMEEIWGTQPPHSALTTLQTYILQLRRRLGTAMGPSSPGSAKEVLATRHGGYLLQIAEGCVDVHDYDRLTREGQALCFFAGANSIFYGDKLLTAANPGVDADRSLLKELGLGISKPELVAS